MEQIKKVFTGTKALALSSLMSALVLIMILISTYLVDLGILIMFFLPLFSTIITLTCEKKYVLVYFVASLLMSFINFQIAIFEIIPALIIGLLVGGLIRIKAQGFVIIFLSSLVLTTIQVLSTYLINIIYEVDMVVVFSSLFKIKLDTMILIYPLFLFTLSLIQATISYLISTNELKKLGYLTNEKNDSFYGVIITTIVMMVFSIISYFIEKSLSFLFLGASIFFMITLSKYLYSYKRRTLMLFVQTGIYITSLILVYVLLSFVNIDYFPLVLLILPFGSILGSTVIIGDSLDKKEQITESSFDKLS